MQIAERLLDGTHPIINKESLKDVIRGVLRSLNMQLYIEKWLQIIQRCTPPSPAIGYSLCWVLYVGAAGIAMGSLMMMNTNYVHPFGRGPNPLK